MYVIPVGFKKHNFTMQNFSEAFVNIQKSQLFNLVVCKGVVQNIAALSATIVLKTSPT